jgi:hypothetical protein
MKDFDESHKICFGAIDTEKTLDLVRLALDFLWKEKRKAGLDKVAGDYTYEELISALLHAEASELARQNIEQMYDDLVDKHNATL